MADCLRCGATTWWREGQGWLHAKADGPAVYYPHEDATGHEPMACWDFGLAHDAHTVDGLQCPRVTADSETSPATTQTAGKDPSNKAEGEKQ